MELMTVQHPGGDITVTQPAFEMAVQRYAHNTLGNLRDMVNEQGETEHRSLTWVQVIASLADFDFNVDGSAFSVDYYQRTFAKHDAEARARHARIAAAVAERNYTPRCLVEAGTGDLWECPCNECVRLQRSWHRHAEDHQAVTGKAWLS